MLTLLKSYLGYPQTLEDEGDRDSEDIDIEPGPPAEDSYSPPTRRPYHGSDLPIECDPSSELHDFFFEQFIAAPSRDGASVLVFSKYFQSEVNGTAVFDDWGLRDEGLEAIARVGKTVRIYEHLFSDQSSHPRIVRYLGRTVSGYRLERLSPGPCIDTSHLPPANESDAVLALYRRWALQVLSSLRFIHSKGIVTNTICEAAFWLRPDLSLAFACFLNAASIEVDVSCGAWGDTTMIDSQWVPRDGRIDPPYAEREVGHPKRDLFDWAVMVFRWMSEGQGPLDGLYTKDLAAWEQVELDRAVAEGRFDDWPVLGRRFLGSALLKAWRGEYESAGEAFSDVRETLVEFGRTLSVDCEDEIEGYDWMECFRVEKDDYRNKMLHFNRHTEETEGQ